jgi:hypothetical protein
MSNACCEDHNAVVTAWGLQYLKSGRRMKASAALLDQDAEALLRVANEALPPPAAAAAAAVAVVPHAAAQTVTSVIAPEITLSLDQPTANVTVTTTGTAFGFVAKRIDNSGAPPFCRLSPRGDRSDEDRVHTVEVCADAPHEFMPPFVDLHVVAAGIGYVATWPVLRVYFSMGRTALEKAIDDAWLGLDAWGRGNPDDILGPFPDPASALFNAVSDVAKPPPSNSSSHGETQQALAAKLRVLPPQQRLLLSRVAATFCDLRRVAAVSDDPLLIIALAAAEQSGTLGFFDKLYTFARCTAGSAAAKKSAPAAGSKQGRATTPPTATDSLVSVPTVPVSAVYPVKHLGGAAANTNSDAVQPVTKKRKQ